MTNALSDIARAAHIGMVRILVADDERDIADSLEKFLRQQGHEVRVAYDGAEALKAAQRFQPDVAILDIEMPELNGYDAARALRARNRGVVLVAVTGWHQPTDRIIARMAGFDHHFGKPCDPLAILELLATLGQRS